MSKWLRYGGIILCFLGFAVIRFRESELFYDPLIAFFKGDYQGQSLPELHVPKLLLHTVLRFMINMGLSLIILWLAFKDRGILKFSLLIFLSILVLLTGVFYILLQDGSGQVYKALFYVRRFLIQPLLILLLLPAFYYYRASNKQ